MIDPETLSKAIVEAILNLSNAQDEFRAKQITANQLLTRKEMTQIKLQRTLELNQ